MFSWLQVTLADTFMPFQGTGIAGEVDNLYMFLLVSSLISFIILIGGMTYYILRFKRKTNEDKTLYITHNTFLEFLWSFIPFVIMMVIFFWGKVIYDKVRHIPEAGEEIQVNALQWAWQVKYKNGIRLNSKTAGQDVMHIPVNKPVKIILTASDVLHSFYIPAFRIKQDAIPGRVVYLGFTADKPGLYQVFCAEYCGVDHSNMPLKIKAESQAEYDAWLANNVPKEAAGGNALAAKGATVYNEKTCVGCHSLDGSPRAGPTWKGLYEAKREFADGTTGQANDAYLRESILEPGKKIVKGFGPVMPSFKGQLDDEEIQAVIEYMKSLK